MLKHFLKLPLTGHDKWFVEYPNGRTSQKMYYHEARNYQSVFGGEIKIES